MTENNQHQSFSIGFSLGLLSGVVGYYLYGTKEGKSLRIKLASEWEKSKDYLAKSGIIDPKTQSLTDFLADLKSQLYDALEISDQKKIISTKSRSKQLRSKRKMGKKKQLPKKFIQTK
jgi:hypothetical protein